MSEFLKVGGANAEGIARALRVNDKNNLNVELDTIEETVIRDEITIPAGGSERINIPTLKPYRIFVVLHDNFQRPWDIRYRPFIGGKLVSESGLQTLIGSDGENVINGKGTRGTAYTDIMVPEGSRTEFNVRNHHSSSIKFTIMLIEYSNITLGDRKKYLKNITRRMSETLSPQETKTVLDISVPSAIDFLEFSTNGDCQIDLMYNGTEGSINERILGTVRPDGSGFAGISPSSVPENGSGIFEIVDHNITTNNYKYRLNRTLEFPGGYSVRVKNWSTTDENSMAVRIYGREIDCD